MNNGYRKKKKGIFLRIVLAIFAIYVVVMTVQLLQQINTKQAEIDALQAQKLLLERENEEIQGYIDNAERFKEQQAHAAGWGHPGEDIYKESP